MTYTARAPYQKRMCILCGKEPAVVPDRDSNDHRTKKVCRQCHGKRLLGDLRAIMSTEKTTGEA
jgi:hypothetical protein